MIVNCRLTKLNKGEQSSTRRLTFEETIKNRKDAIKALMEMPKSELVDYILGINNKTFLELVKIQNKEF